MDLILADVSSAEVFRALNDSVILVLSWDS